MEYDRFQLEDGRTVVLEELEEQDLPEMMEVFNSVIEEDAYFPRNEGVPDLEGARQWHQDHVKTGLFYLAAKVNSQFVGGATIEPLRGKVSHVAWLGIYLKRQFRNIGIGTRLIEKLIEIARERGFEKIRLMVFASNLQALRLYEKLGFQEVGRIKHGIKFRDGSYTDEVIMLLDLQNLKPQ